MVGDSKCSKEIMATGCFAFVTIVKTKEEVVFPTPLSSLL